MTNNITSIIILYLFRGFVEKKLHTISLIAIIPITNDHAESFTKQHCASAAAWSQICSLQGLLSWKETREVFLRNWRAALLRNAIPCLTLRVAIFRFHFKPRDTIRVLCSMKSVIFHVKFFGRILISATVSPLGFNDWQGLSTSSASNMLAQSDSRGCLLKFSL